MTTRDDLVSRLRNNHFAGMETMRAFALSIIDADVPALEAKDAEIAVKEQAIVDLARQLYEATERAVVAERQLASETDRCVAVAFDQRQQSNQINDRSDAAERAYEQACEDIAAAIRGGAK